MMADLRFGMSQQLLLVEVGVGVIANPTPAGLLHRQCCLVNAEMGACSAHRRQGTVASD